MITMKQYMAVKQFQRQGETPLAKDATLFFDLFAIEEAIPVRWIAFSLVLMVAIISAFLLIKNRQKG